MTPALPYRMSLKSNDVDPINDVIQINVAFEVHTKDRFALSDHRKFIP